jgi:hypothetical protein
MKLLAVLLLPLKLFGQFTYCGTDTVINLTTQSGLIYEWNVDGFLSTNQDAQLTINRTGAFFVELTVQDANGCVNSDKKVLEVAECKEWTYYAPNAFSPNGINKTWTPVGENITIDLIRIFTREGQVIFEGIGVWDGKYLNRECMGGVYVYTCDYTTVFGTKLRDLGRVTLVR